MAWRRRWWVHVWTGGLGVGSMADDAEGVRQIHLDNVAALRDLITQLRADPTVRRWTFGPFDELDKTGEPTHCPCGRELNGLRGFAAEYRWRLCVDCPGHGQYRCRNRALLHQMQQFDTTGPRQSSRSARSDDADQQRARFLKHATVHARLAVLRRFAQFTKQYPWQWQPGEVDAFFASLNSGDRPIAESTARGYQISLRLFCDFATDPRYGWAAACDERFGQVPVQLLHEWNTVAHVAQYEGRPGRRDDVRRGSGAVRCSRRAGRGDPRPRPKGRLGRGAPS